MLSSVKKKKEKKHEVTGWFN
uniref:Uncharacterized protein n=1 Tax=Anguilla anguilla TaxID=7936 RepID=A0A0E9SB66_ANGAN